MRWRIRARSSFDAAIVLALQHTHRIFDADLLGGKLVENGTSIQVSVTLRRTAECGDDLIQAATRSVICNIHLCCQALHIAPMLDQQFYKVQLLTRQTTNPAQTETPLDDDAALRTFQTGRDHLAATYRITRYQWIHGTTLLRQLSSQ